MFQDHGLKQLSPAETFRVAQYLLSRKTKAENKDALCCDIYEATGLAMSNSRLNTVARMLGKNPSNFWNAVSGGGGAVRADVAALEDRVAAIEKKLEELFR